METALISIKKICGSDIILGSHVGRELLNRLRQMVSHYGPQVTVELSFEGIVIIDACAVRESVASLVKLHSSPTVCFFISNVSNQDVMENILYGFNAARSSILIKQNNGCLVISKLTKSSFEILEYVYLKEQISSLDLATNKEMSIPHASLKLKELMSIGLLTGLKIKSKTGGHEYRFKPIIKNTKLVIFNY